ncbi:MAG: ABC transporter ATP-binding protein [Pseudomonadota bacterium]
MQHRPVAMTSSETAPYLSIEGVSRRFTRKMTTTQRLLSRIGADYRDETVHAVDHVDLQVPRGSVMGLVGESGCGKSTLGRIVAALLSPSEGRVRLAGDDLESLPPRALLRVQMIFQNPMASLNPRRSVIDTITEGPLRHGMIKPRERQSFAAALMDEVGLPRDALDRLPHQFSGGQRQRIGIARALSVSPDVLICDEPVAALDVSVQAQILNLLADLRQRRQLTALFISHDLGVVRHLCDRVAVMYLGRIVEEAPTETLFTAPRHPYTAALLAGMPRIRAGQQTYAPVTGELPSPLDPPGGCHFHPRCIHAEERCRTDVPATEKVSADHLVRCWRWRDMGALLTAA